MDNIERFNRKSRKRDDEKRHNEIMVAWSKYLKYLEISSLDLDDQNKQMKKIQKHFIDLSHRPSLKQREFLQVKILNGISPKQLFVMKTSDELHANKFHSDIQCDYDNNRYELVFCLKTGLYCMAKTTANGWQRCRITRLHPKGVCTVLLLDIGRSEHIKWIDLRMLDAKWYQQRPFAIRCSLVDIESASPIFRFTQQQQQRFTQILEMYEDFYISVNRSCSIASDVFLYYVLDKCFHCVNEIFPSDLSSADDDDDDERKIEESMLSSSGGKNAVDSIKTAADFVKRGASSTFITKNERSVESMERSGKSTANKMSMPMANENKIEVKKESTMHAVEMKNPSHRTVPVPLDQQRLTRPEDVIVRHIDDIGSVFICFKKYKSALDIIRFEIQKQIRREQDSGNGGQSDDDLAWNVGDYCLVLGKFEGFSEWLRGKITHISATLAAKDGDRSVQVYLRDVGKTVETQLRKLKPIHHNIDGSVRNVRDIVWKTRLAYIEIDQRSEQFAKKLDKILNSFDEIAISILDSLGDQYDVILWGIMRDVQALQPEKIVLTNINEELVKQGYAFTHTKLDSMNDFVTNLMNPVVSLNDSTRSHSLPQSTYVVTDEYTDVVEWLPSEPILQPKFVAIPMYVNQKCLLSILDANRQTIADKIKDILGKKYKFSKLECRDATQWKVGDPCFVRFPADGQFYRGSVRRVNFAKDFCMIRFIDYGNCAPCSFDDLRKATMFGNIPILSRLYQLDNICSMSGNGIWPDNVRDFCSEAVVERQCNLIVTDPSPASKYQDQPTLCKLEIFTKDRDLATALVSRGMADWIRTPVNTNS